ncbi:MAG: OmpA family protein [Bacteroidota bacterium]
MPHPIPILLLLLLFRWSAVDAQNLVPNSSFEKTSSCPKAFADFTAMDWKNPNANATPDLHATCAPANVAINPAHNWNRLNPANGSNYAGLVVWTNDPDQPDYTETIYTTLTAPLEAGKTYLIEFYVAAPYLSRWLINAIDVQLTKQEPNKNPVPGTILTFDLNIRKLTTGWSYLSKTYTAKGGERYLLIGELNGRQSLQARKIPDRNESMHINTYDLAYLGIDEVSVTKTDLTETEAGNGVPAALILRNLNFATDSWKLSDETIPELEGLIRRMKIQAELQVTIDGYTDNAGTEEHNQELSLKRAQSVATYLVSRGVDLDRITANGYGDANAVGDNETEEGRRLNRRVELRLSE